MSKFIGNNPLVYTVKCRCRVCYTCVRECPVKAIKIINGQAEVITERCIACGNCVKVCSQGAKAYYGSIEAVEVLLESNQKTVACVAPAFPAEFSEINDYRIFVGMVKSLGFDYVVEVSFGADLVAKEYKKLLNNGENYPIISSDCPAIVNYISYYHPDLVNFLAPVATPIMATARIVRQKYGKDTKIVFIGPCVAKKAESKETDEVLTFTELRSMFERFKITPESVEARDFDPPASGKGAIFPISRGLLRNAEKPESLSESDIIVTHGYNNFREAIEELKAGEVDVKYLELLCCDGCIMGPGMSKGGRRFMRRTVVTNYVRTKLLNLDITQWKADLKEFNDINLLQTFRASERIIEQPFREIR